MEGVPDSTDLGPSNEKEKLEDMLAKYLNDSFIEDGNIIGFFDEIETFSIISEKMRDKGYTYSVRDSDMRKKPKCRDEETGPDGDKEGGIVQSTVFYQLKAMSIKFFGLPFIIDKTTHYQCVYGRKYYKSKTRPSKNPGDLATLPMKKRRNGVSKKMGCLARMTIKKIIVYPDYKLDVETDWRKKKKIIECLRKDLSDENKQVENFYRYYLSVSVQSSHNHPPMVQGNVTPDKSKRVHRNSFRKTTSLKLRIKDNYAVTDERWECFPSGSVVEDEPAIPVSVPEPKTIVLQDTHFLSPFVKFQDNFDGSELKPTTIIEVINSFEPQDEPRMIQIQAIQYNPSAQDLQTLFREKLKRLYTLSESCFSPSLLIRLVGELEQMEMSLHSETCYETNE